MHQVGELPPGHLLFKDFAKDNALVRDDILWTGRACPELTEIGRCIISSAHQNVIQACYWNQNFGWQFLLSDLAVSEDTKLYIRTKPCAFSSTQDKALFVLRTLHRLHRFLLPFFKCSGKPALFVEHLAMFVKYAPSEIYNSEPVFMKFLEVLYHHFSFAHVMDVHNLIIGIATGYTSLGSEDQEVCRIYINNVPRHINLPFDWTWSAIAQESPLLRKVLDHNKKWKRANSENQGDVDSKLLGLKTTRDDSEMLGAFMLARNSEVHGGQNIREEICEGEATTSNEDEASTSNKDEASTSNEDEASTSKERMVCNSSTFCASAFYAFFY